MKANTSEFKVYYDDFIITKQNDGRWHYTHQYYTNAFGIADTLQKAKRNVDDYHDMWENYNDYYDDMGDD
jgi:hypothetical protein